MDKRKIVRYLLITLSVILGVLVFLSITSTVVHAAGLVDNSVSDANTYSKYPLENYQLDFYVDSSWDWLPWNWLDGIGKSIQYGLYAITNFVWTVSLYISNATGYVVQEAYKLDFISDTASSIGKNIQTLAGVTSSGFSSEGFYVGFLLILILVMGIYVAYTGLIKRETTKAVGAMGKLVSVYLVPHRHSMTLRSTYRCHRRKLVTWYSFTPLIILERMSPMWESMQETTECITLATLSDMQI